MFFSSFQVVAAAAIDIDITVGFMLILFLVLYLVLKPLLLKPYLEAIDMRREGVEGAREDAAGFEARAESAISEYEDKIRRARRDAADVRETIRAQGTEEQNEMLDDERQKLNVHLEEERQKIEAQVDEAIAELEERSRRLSDVIVEKILPAAAAAALVVFLPGVAHAAGGAGGGSPWPDILVGWLNFAVFVGIIVYFGGPRIQEYFSDRRKTLTENLEEARRLREEAQARLDEYSERLDGLEEEKKKLLDEYHEQGEREKKRIIEEAQRQVERMRKDAELVIEQEHRKAVARIQQQAVDMAVDLARDRIEERLDDHTRDALFDRYVDEVESMNA